MNLFALSTRERRQAAHASALEAAHELEGRCEDIHEVAAFSVSDHEHDREFVSCLIGIQELLNRLVSGTSFKYLSRKVQARVLRRLSRQSRTLDNILGSEAPITTDDPEIRQLVTSLVYYAEVLQGVLTGDPEYAPNAKD